MNIKDGASEAELLQDDFSLVQSIHRHEANYNIDLLVFDSLPC